MSILKGNVTIAGLQTNTIVSGFNIFDCKWSDHIINDIQWLRADTFSWQDGDVYTLAYNTLVNEYSSGTTETEDGITFRRTTNGYKIADSTQENAILSKYNSKSIAWYYILDTTNHRFKLPRTKFGFEGLRGNVGDDIAESLPNIKGSTATSTSNYTSTGAFQNGSTLYNFGPDNSAFGYQPTLTYFDASLSSSTYQNNAPVQERATQMYLYFYIGEYAKTAIEQTAGITSEQLNAKVDLNASNLNASGKSLISGLGMPSNSYNVLSLGASGARYTAPANGWYLVYYSATSTYGEVDLVNLSNALRDQRTIENGRSAAQFLPVKKGSTVAVYYNNINCYSFYFYYADGEV